MPRKATGTVVYVPARPGERYGHYKVRVTSAVDGSRPWFHLPPGPESSQAKKRAQKKAEFHSEQVRTGGMVLAPQRRTKVNRQTAPVGSETVTDYVARWFADRERRGLTGVKTDAGRLALHALPVIGGSAIADVTRDELRAIVERLDTTVRSGSITWSTAGKVWGLITKLFADACDSKTAALRVREDNPCANLPGPDRGERKGKQWLYPVELVPLVACEDVPLRWRRLYALASYLYLRPGELAALEWGDVHVALGYVYIHQALDLRTGELKSTKTKHTRKVPIHPSLAPLLEAMAQKTGRVLQNTHPNKDAEHGFPPLKTSRPRCAIT